LLVFPPVVRGQAAAGDDPGLVVAVGVLVAVVVGRADEVWDGETEAAPVRLGGREADAVGVDVGADPESGCGPQALTTTMPIARASAP
jgi:hypothetical protein